MTRLGDLERAAMDVVWASPQPLTAREVADALADRDLAYTTWLTVLGRLERKGLLRRDKRARAHTYAPTASREDHVAVLLQEVLDQAGDRTAVLQHFARSVTEEERVALEEALRAARENGRETPG